MLKDLQPPPTEPITLAEAKTFLRLDHDAEDALLETLIASARERLEARLNLALITRPMQLAMSSSGEIALPRWPVASVDTVIADGAPTTDFHADLRKRPSTVTVCADDHVEVEFTAGYGTTPADVPAPLRQAMLLLVARSYEYRGEGEMPLPLMVDALTLPYRVVGL